jgi:hypothetical protein
VEEVEYSGKWWGLQRFGDDKKLLKLDERKCEK